VGAATSSNVVGVPPLQVIDWWEEAGPRIQKALDTIETGYRLEDVAKKILSQHAQLWVIPGKAAAVTEIHIYPQHKTLVISFLGGDDMASWFDDMMNVLESYAKVMECRYIEEYGRPGWERIGNRIGFEKVYTVMRKDLVSE